jgi:hypothetical protein
MSGSRAIRSVFYALTFCGIAAAATDETNNRTASDKQALAPLQAYVGGWRGVGQLRRGSSRGAWSEQSDWSWRFDAGRAELVGDVAGAKFFSRLRLQAADRPGEYVLLAAPAAGKQSDSRRFVGTLEGDTLALTAAGAPDGQPARITLRLVAGGDRMVVLYEKRQGEVYSRLGEVGSTRKGSSFAKTAASGPECIVTGGLGTIAVEYEGKKYFVCCSGCKELFDDDPAAVIEEYRQRKAQERSRRDPD